MTHQDTDNETIEASDPLAVFAAVRPEIPTGGETTRLAEAALTGAIAAEGAAAAKPSRGRRVSVMVGGVAVAAAAVTALGMLLPSATPKSIRDTVGTPAAGASELLQKAADSERAKVELAEPIPPDPAVVAALATLPTDATPDQVWDWADGRCADPMSAMDFQPGPKSTAKSAGLTTEGCGVLVVSGVLTTAQAETRADLLDALASLPKLSLDQRAPSCKMSIGGNEASAIASIQATRGGINVVLIVYEDPTTKALTTQMMDWMPGSWISGSVTVGSEGAPSGAQGASVETSGSATLTEGGGATENSFEAVGPDGSPLELPPDAVVIGCAG